MNDHCSQCLALQEHIGGDTCISNGGAKNSPRRMLKSCIQLSPMCSLTFYVLCQICLYLYHTLLLSFHFVYQSFHVSTQSHMVCFVQLLLFLFSLVFFYVSTCFSFFSVHLLLRENHSPCPFTIVAYILSFSVTSHDCSRHGITRFSCKIFTDKILLNHSLN